MFNYNKLITTFISELFIYSWIATANFQAILLISMKFFFSQRKIYNLIQVSFLFLQFTGYCVVIFEIYATYVYDLSCHKGNVS